MYKVLFPDESSIPEEQLLGQFIPLHYHSNMLMDQWRMESFQQAINQVVTPGCKVLELGGGTGVLSYFAAKQGAKVYCVERNPALVKSARAFLEMNKVSDNVEVIQADAMDYLPPEPVDVVICEMLHVAMVCEKQLNVLNNFQKRYREKYPQSQVRYIPEASLLAVQAIQYDFEFYGYVAPVPLFQNPLSQEVRTQAITDPAIYSTICYDENIPLNFNWEALIPASQAGRVNAIRFITKNILTIDVQSTQTTEWSNQFLVVPIIEPQSINQGDMISLSFSYNSGCSLSDLSSSLEITPKPEKKIA